jgi:predicted phosphoribosyltransferase
LGKLRIVSYSDESFGDRKEAGRLLASILKDLQLKDTIVLGIPRGGMVVANEIHLFLNSGIDLVLARKIGAPGNPELAIGSISEDGKLFLNEDLAFRTGADKAYIEKEKSRQLEEIKNRRQIFRKLITKLPLKAKTVIVTDDGVATGATMQAALWATRQEKPKRLIAAIPVGAKEPLGLLVDYADEVVALRVPEYLGAISQFYKNFGQTSDEEVLAILQTAAKIRDNLDEKNKEDK